VFLISLDNGRKVVARLPTRLAGPPRLTLSSEVATLAYGKASSSLSKQAHGTDALIQSERRRPFPYPKFSHGARSPKTIP